jgi:NitT/TauT family transport system permease protein
MNPRTSRRRSEFLLTILAPLTVLVLWEGLSRGGFIDSRFWPAPTSLAATFRELTVEGNLIGDVQATLFRVLGGFLLGAVPAVALGLAMGLFWPVRVFFMPIAAAIYALPKISLLPLVLITFGRGESSKLFMVALSIFFLVVLSTMSGVLAINQAYRDVARNLGASRWQTFVTVAFPGAMPATFTGLRLGLGFALIVIVGTEFLSPGDGGVGNLIWESWQVLRIRHMFVGLIVTGLIGWALTLTLDVIERVIVPWKPAG